MMETSIKKLIIIYTVIIVKSGLCQRDILKTFDQLIQDTSMSRMGNFVIKYPDRRDGSIRAQITFPKSVPFPCANVTKLGIGRSFQRPTSVHRLRPGDIDVIGALGDSLVAGNGAMEEYALGTMIEYRGVSWCAGGQGTWREFVTLPNILKEFNPNLTGYSTGTGEFLSSHSRLNAAFPVAADADAFRQAKILVKKMKTNPDIDIKRDWKMITIFFGANDICSGQCFDKEAASSSNHVKKLARALDYLEKNLPRTLVNLIPVLDVSVSLRIKRTMMCRLLHRLFCECFHRGGNEMDVITSLTKAYQRAEEELVLSGRYDEREDFTVVLQPFMKLFNAPDDPAHRFDEVIDISYITHDCFHFSQKGHALALFLRNMWMLYASQNWTKAVDISSAVERLTSELDALSKDSHHAINYDLSVCYDEEQIQYCLRDAENYQKGVDLCEKYTDGSLELDQLCHAMVECELKRFLYRLLPYLPEGIIQKYQLDYLSEDEIEDGQENSDDEEEIILDCLRIPKTN